MGINFNLADRSCSLGAERKKGRRSWPGSLSEGEAREGGRERKRNTVSLYAGELFQAYGLDRYSAPVTQIHSAPNSMIHLLVICTLKKAHLSETDIEKSWRER